MKREEEAGKAMTVLGPVSAGSLGKTLMHEHIFIDISRLFMEPSGEDEKRMAYEKVQLENLYWIRLHVFNNVDNLCLIDEDLAVKEVMLFKLAGGGTITHVTPCGELGRNPQGLVRISKKTGLNIVMGTGYYVSILQPPELASRTEQEIADEMVKEITVGFEDTGIRAGIIGEIGCSAPLDKNEHKVLLSCAEAQRRTGAAIYLHPSPGDDLVLEDVRVLKDAGANLDRVIVGHMDIQDYSSVTCRKLMDQGCYIGFDSFGLEGFLDVPRRGYVEASDVKRIDRILSFIKQGYTNHLLISQDVGTKDRLTSFAGTGYAHILRDVVPIMNFKGISEEQIDTILVKNPRRVLSLKPA
jgi:phosphotriesterase-related protein